MPEKIADTPVNGATRPMPEKAPEKIAETTRKYMQEAEKVGEDAFRMYNDLMTTTTNYYFDTLDKTMHDTMEMTMRAEHAMEDMLVIYRRSITEGMKSWQAWWQDANKAFIRPK